MFFYLLFHPCAAIPCTSIKAQHSRLSLLLINQILPLQSKCIGKTSGIPTLLCIPQECKLLSRPTRKNAPRHITPHSRSAIEKAMGTKDALLHKSVAIEARCTSTAIPGLLFVSHFLLRILYTLGQLVPWTVKCTRPRSTVIPSGSCPAQHF